MESSSLQMAVAVLTGVALGLFFFGGLRLTVNWLKTTERPLLVAMTSFVVRLAIATAGFVFVGSGRWERYAAALIGFFLMRIVLLRFWGPTRYQPPPAKEEEE